MSSKPLTAHRSIDPEFLNYLPAVPCPAIPLVTISRMRPACGAASGLPLAGLTLDLAAGVAGQNGRTGGSDWFANQRASGWFAPGRNPGLR
jgi:hypothetical protein